MPKLTRLGVLFFGKLQGAIMAVVGLIAGIFYSFGGFTYELFTGNLNAGTAMAFGALIGMPLIFACGGFAAGVVEAIIYNLSVRFFGGISVDMETR